MPLALLKRELYSTTEAARLLKVNVRTLVNWLEGYERRGVRYPPVVRPTPTGSELLTWGEFVECALLAEYRRRRDVPLQHIRPVVEALRERYDTPYPLALARPYVADRELVVEVQTSADVPSGLRFVVERKGQFVLEAPAQTFFAKVQFEDDVARYLFPAGPKSSVRIDPAHNFGLPEVAGIRTETLFELFEAGDSIAALGDAYELNPSLVEDAIRFESGQPRSPEPVAA